MAMAARMLLCWASRPLSRSVPSFRINIGCLPDNMVFTGNGIIPVLYKSFFHATQLHKILFLRIKYMPMFVNVLLSQNIGLSLLESQGTGITEVVGDILIKPGVHSAYCLVTVMADVTASGTANIATHGIQFLRGLYRFALYTMGRKKS
jgi:hypothetical protein